MENKKKRERFYYERHGDGSLTGITVCTSEEGIQGYSYCHPGKYLVDGEADCMTIITEIQPDQFRKLTGREIAKGRMEKLEKLLKDADHDEKTALNTIYSGRMKTRIKQFQQREADREFMKIEDSE